MIKVATAWPVHRLRHGMVRSGTVTSVKGQSDRRRRGHAARLQPPNQWQDWTAPGTRPPSDHLRSALGHRRRACNPKYHRGTGPDSATSPSVIRRGPKNRCLTNGEYIHDPRRPWCWPERQLPARHVVIRRAGIRMLAARLSPVSVDALVRLERQALRGTVSVHPSWLHRKAAQWFGNNGSSILAEQGQFNAALGLGWLGSLPWS